MFIVLYLGPNGLGVAEVLLPKVKPPEAGFACWPNALVVPLAGAGVDPSPEKALGVPLAGQIVSNKLPRNHLLEMKIYTYLLN